MDAYDETIQELRDLARDRNIRDARKLYLYARSKGMAYVSQQKCCNSLEG